MEQRVTIVTLGVADLKAKHGILRTPRMAAFNGQR
jgi:hypothetical protein